MKPILQRIRYVSASIFLACCMLCGALCIPHTVRAKAYTDTDATEFGIGMSPSVITKPVTSDDYTAALTAAPKPGSILFSCDSNGNACSEDGSVLGNATTVKSALDAAGILAVVRVADASAATALVTEATQNKWSDYCILGGDREILRAAKEGLPSARVCYDASSQAAPQNRYGYIEAARSVGAHIVLMSAAQADTDTVCYLQGMLTTVWVAPASQSTFDIAGAVTSGAYGIVSSVQAGVVYDVLDGFIYGSIVRPYYNIGHRGLPSSENENSLDGCIAAYEAGATHLEIDVHVTADNHLVVMHDATIDRTTDGQGTVQSMTLAQLNQYHIIKTIGGATTGKQSPIPTLDDIFSYFKDKNVVLVVEIKCTNGNFCDLFAACLDEYDIYDQVIAISFFEDQLQRLNALRPQVPSATLRDVTDGNLETYIPQAAKYNFCFDMPNSTSYTLMNGNLKNRGYMSYCWTYGNYMNIIDGVKMGVTGITNNTADNLKDHVKAWETTALKCPEGADITKHDFNVELRTYDGGTKNAKARVYLYEQTEKGYRAILRYNDGHNIWLCSPVVEIETVKQPKKGCGVSMATAWSGVALLMTALTLRFGQRVRNSGKKSAQS